METNENVYLGLDIGTSKICASLCELTVKGEVQVRGVGTHMSAGLNKGTVTDSEALCQAIQKAIQRAEQTAHCQTDKVLLNIPAQNLQFLHNTGLFISRDESGQISQQDKVECIRRSKNVALSSEQTLLHAIPLLYKVEGTPIQNPVGVFGQSIELDTHLILSKTQVISDIKTILKSLGYYINGFVFSALAQSQVLLDNSERKKGVVLVDIGGSSTTVAVFQNNLLQQAHVLPLGSHILTTDVATCLNVSIPEAERLKILYGDTALDRISPDELIEVITIKDGQKKIKKQLLCQIIHARIVEIFKHVKAAVPLISHHDYSVVLGGGGSLLRGVTTYCKSDINPTVRNGLPESLLSSMESPLYSTSVGTVLYGLKNHAIDYIPTKYSLLKQCKQWFQKLSFS